MTKIRYSVLLIGALGMAAATSPTMAADSSWYVGGSLGQVRTGIDTAGVDRAVRASGAASSATTADDSDTGWKLYVGYQFSPVFALEAHYSDLGNISTTTTTSGPTGTIGGNFDFKAWGLDAVGTLPVGKQFDLFGKIGFYQSDIDGRAPRIVGGAPSTASISDDNTGVKFGVGGRYHFTDHVALRLEWEHFNDVGNAGSIGGGSFNLFTLGLQFKF